MAGDRSTPRGGGGPGPRAGRCPAAAGRRQAPGRPRHSARRRSATLVPALAARSRKRCASRLAINDRLACRPGRTDRCGALGLRKPAVGASDRPRLSVPAIGSRRPLAGSGRFRRALPCFQHRRGPARRAAAHRWRGHLSGRQRCELARAVERAPAADRVRCSQKRWKAFDSSTSRSFPALRSTHERSDTNSQFGPPVPRKGGNAAS